MTDQSSQDRYQISPAIDDQLASWHRVFANRGDGVDARLLLRNAAREIWSALLVDQTVHPEAHDYTRQYSVDVLAEMATNAGIDADDAQFIFQEAFRPAVEQPNGHSADILGIDYGGSHQAQTSVIKTNQQFLDEYIPPDYLVDGIIQRRFLYALTAPTSFGKTAVAIRLLAHVIRGSMLGKISVEQGKVLFLAGENPDDVRMRWIKTCEELGIDALVAEDNVFWVSGILSLQAMREKINQETKRHGPFSLIIIDSGAAFFEGNDENANAQMGAYARMLRSLIEIKGGPSILVLCHPVKNFDMDNLLPRGGGAFLNEVDCNLVLKRISEVPKVVELTWQGKIRGPDFSPISFKLTTCTSDKIKDSKGRLIWTVTAAPMTDDEAEQAEVANAGKQRELMAAMERLPGASLVRLAEACGWFYRDGKPHKTLAYRIMRDLKDAGLIAQNKDGHWLPKGKK